MRPVYESSVWTSKTVNQTSHERQKGARLDYLCLLFVDASKSTAATELSASL